MGHLEVAETGSPGAHYWARREGEVEASEERTASEVSEKRGSGSGQGNSVIMALARPESYPTGKYLTVSRSTGFFSRLLYDRMVS